MKFNLRKQFSRNAAQSKMELYRRPVIAIVIVEIASKGWQIKLRKLRNYFVAACYKGVYWQSSDINFNFRLLLSLALSLSLLSLILIFFLLFIFIFTYACFFVLPHIHYVNKFISNNNRNVRRKINGLFDMRMCIFLNARGPSNITLS